MSYLEDAKDELKRADHLVFISLKYTRTCDIIRNTIERIINAYEFIILASLESAKNSNRIDSIPKSKLERVELIQKLKRNIKEDIKTYLLLIDIFNSKFERREEYRKNVTLIAKFKKDDIEINVPSLMDHFEKIKEFYTTMEAWIKWLDL